MQALTVIDWQANIHPLPNCNLLTRRQRDAALLSLTGCREGWGNWIHIEKDLIRPLCTFHCHRILFTFILVLLSFHTLVILVQLIFSISVKKTKKRGEKKYNIFKAKRSGFHLIPKNRLHLECSRMVNHYMFKKVTTCTVPNTSTPLSINEALQTNWNRYTCHMKWERKATNSLLYRVQNVNQDTPKSLLK